MNYLALQLDFDKGYAEETSDNAALTVLCGLPAEARKMLEQLEKARELFARSAWYKAKASKAALVALLNNLPKWARSLVAWLYVISQGPFHEDIPPPIHLALVSSQGAHAPPRDSDYRRGTRPHSQKEPEGLRAVPLRDINRDT